jgi:rubredoxin
MRIVKINFRGGIISPGELYQIVRAAQQARVTKLSFGLRQQMLLHLHTEDYPRLKQALDKLQVLYETDTDKYPNIISSYPAEEVFIRKNWLTEGVYKDIFDLMEDYHPRFKINISDTNQSFTPMLTGNINWVASPSQHFWHLLVRFPKTNTIFEWDQLVYTNDLPRFSRRLEDVIYEHRSDFYDNPAAQGTRLIELVLEGQQYITQASTTKAVLPTFNLPYYEGINRYDDKYWLGIYRRDECFSSELLIDICSLCLDTKIGQICSTPWKTLMVKGIEEKDRPMWNLLLSRHMLNIRHAANELNFQVEDNSAHALELKHHLVNHLNSNDMRTFGLCIGIKTTKKTEVFSSILVKRRPLLTIGAVEMFFVYDILCAKDYNPNQRTSAAFAKNVPGFLLATRLQQAVLQYYKEVQEKATATVRPVAPVPEKSVRAVRHHKMYQCPHCFTVYDESVGEADRGIPAGTSFSKLPADYTCFVCDAAKTEFVIREHELEIG